MSDLSFQFPGMKMNLPVSFLIPVAVVTFLLSVQALGADKPAVIEKGGPKAPKVLFIGNSFTFGAGSAVQFYRAPSVTDLKA